jgi:hypothetical protein
LSEPEIGRLMSISPLLVLEQGDGQGHRQLGRVRALDRFAEGQLIEKDPVLGVQLVVLDLVLDEQRQLALCRSRSRRTLPSTVENEVISMPLIRPADRDRAWPTAG